MLPPSYGLATSGTRKTYTCSFLGNLWPEEAVHVVGNKLVFVSPFWVERKISGFECKKIDLHVGMETFLYYKGVV
jgi:hypothetical protein